MCVGLAAAVALNVCRAGSSYCPANVCRAGSNCCPSYVWGRQHPDAQTVCCSTIYLTGIYSHVLPEAGCKFFIFEFEKFENEFIYCDFQSPVSTICWGDLHYVIKCVSYCGFFLFCWFAGKLQYITEYLFSELLRGVIDCNLFIVMCGVSSLYYINAISNPYVPYLCLRLPTQTC